MSCLRGAWCPQCEQVVDDRVCNCSCSCDRHGQVCSALIPDGTHDHRWKGEAQPYTKQEYHNGWCVGYDTFTREGARVWQTLKPGHATKTPFEVEQDWRDKQAIEYAERRRIRDIEERDQLNCNGGGSI